MTMPSGPISTIRSLMWTLCLWVGCYNPDLSGEGMFVCVKDGTCPEGFFCNADKICVPKGSVGGADQGTASTDAATEADGALPQHGCHFEGDPVEVTLAQEDVAGPVGTALDDLNRILYVSYAAFDTNDDMAYVRMARRSLDGGPWDHGDQLKIDPNKVPEEGLSTAIDVLNNVQIVVFRDLAAGGVMLANGFDPGAPNHIATATELDGSRLSLTLLEPGRIVIAGTGAKGSSSQVTNVVEIEPGAEDSKLVTEIGFTGETLFTNETGLGVRTVREPGDGGPQVRLAFGVILTGPTWRVFETRRTAPGTWPKATALEPLGIGLDPQDLGLGLAEFEGPHFVFPAKPRGQEDPALFYQPPPPQPGRQVTPGGSQPAGFRQPSLAVRQGRVAVTFLDNDDQAWFTAAATPQEPWTEQLLIDDSGDSVLQAEVIGSAHDPDGRGATFEAIYELDQPDRVVVKQRTIRCEF